MPKNSVITAPEPVTDRPSADARAQATEAQMTDDERFKVDVNGEARVSLTVTNTGKRRGTEIVQLYAADTATGLTLPAQQLIGFARVDLEPGASKTVEFLVPMSVLGYTGLSGEFVMEPGPVEVSAGSSSSDIRSSAKFTVTGKTRTIRGEDREFLSVAAVV